MTTPQKNFQYNSPYDQPMQQYPSQSEDYISLDMGGPKQHSNSAITSNEEQTPSRYNPKYYQQNYRNSNSKANKRRSFNHNYGRQNDRRSYNSMQQHIPHNSIERGQQSTNFRYNNEKPLHNATHKNDRDTNDIASYMHPSMTEDPWLELIHRARALEKSKISPNCTSTTISNSDKEQEKESAASDT